MAAAAPLRLLAELCQWEAVKGDDSQRSRVEIPALCSHCETGGKDSSPERQASSLWNGARAALTLSAASMPQSTSHRPQEAWVNIGLYTHSEMGQPFFRGPGPSSSEPAGRTSSLVI